MLSQKQKEKFLAVSGFEYNETHELKGRFKTPYPNNNREWKYSPWVISYLFDLETNCLHMELNHRMTNNRIYCYDIEGKLIQNDEQFKYFKEHI